MWIRTLDRQIDVVTKFFWNKILKHKYKLMEFFFQIWRHKIKMKSIKMKSIP